MSAEIKSILISRIQVGIHEQRSENHPQDFAELCNSIGRVGLINPVVVVKDGDNYVLVAGHRRLAAVRALGHAEILCMVRESAVSVDSEITFAENFCRAALSPIEQAAAIRDCYEQGTMTVEQMARAFHRSENWVAAQIDITNWPQDVLEALHVEAISVAAARNLAVIDEDNYRRFLLGNACENGATARTTSAWLQAWRANKSQEQALAEPVEPGGRPQTPLVPQAPCLCCGVVRRVDQLSHVPMCQECIHTIRNAG